MQTNEIFFSLGLLLIVAIRCNMLGGNEEVDCSAGSQANMYLLAIPRVLPDMHDQTSGFS